MKYTAGQAAKAAGVATSTITNALKSGKISGEKNDNGAWQIDPAELHRVYPPKDVVERDARRGEGPENSGLERLVAVLEAQIADLREDRDHWRAQAERVLPAPALAPMPEGEVGVVAERPTRPGLLARILEALSPSA